MRISVSLIASMPRATSKSGKRPSPPTSLTQCCSSAKKTKQSHLTKRWTTYSNSPRRKLKSIERHHYLQTSRSTVFKRLNNKGACWNYTNTSIWKINLTMISILIRCLSRKRTSNLPLGRRRHQMNKILGSHNRFSLRRDTRCKKYWCIMWQHLEMKINRCPLRRKRYVTRSFSQAGMLRLELRNTSWMKACSPSSPFKTSPTREESTSKAPQKCRTCSSWLV